MFSLVTISPYKPLIAYVIVRDRRQVFSFKEVRQSLAKVSDLPTSQPWYMLHNEAAQQKGKFDWPISVQSDNVLINMSKYAISKKILVHKYSWIPISAFRKKV